jgi:FhaA, N-terminal domain/FHA domain
MGVLDRFERRLQGLVDGAFARAFKSKASKVQPIEIARVLQRVCDDRAAIVSRGRTLVPNEFIVELGEEDYDWLAVYADTLGKELADMVREHAEEQHYSFIGPVTVTFECHGDLATGMFRIRDEAKAGVVPRYAADTQAAQRVGATAYLEVSGGRHHLTRPVTTVGRGSDADLRVDDPGISRRHAQIRVSNVAAEIMDLDSTNGTIVDGRRVRSAALADGSTIRLGNTTLVFRRGDG